MKVMSSRSPVGVLTMAENTHELLQQWVENWRTLDRIGSCIPHAESGGGEQRGRVKATFGYTDDVRATAAA
jgi:hypothetical protein